MHEIAPVLHMVCGKVAAGKSTLATQLSHESNTILISEDDWLGALFADQMTTLADYVRCTAKLRGIMEPHIRALLNAGVSVVLDYPANTVETRDWMRGILAGSMATHQLHLLAPPDEVCLARLRHRNAQGDHPFAPTEEQFHQISKHFVPPSPGEGFNVIVHQPRALPDLAAGELR